MPSHPDGFEVQVATDPIVTLSRSDARHLIGLAERAEKRRSRICAHPTETDRLHEMLVVLDRSSYVRPHKHVGKVESYQIVEQ